MKAWQLCDVAEYSECKLCRTCGTQIEQGDRCHACVTREEAEKREALYQARKLARHRVHKCWIEMHPKSDNRDCETSKKGGTF
jgi:hypothetical protein